MLQGQNRRRHQHGHLLAVGRGLERRSDRHFGLAEAHIAANQTIHRLIDSMSRLTACVAVC